MNINFIASRALTPVYPIVQVEVHTFSGQTNFLGAVTPAYNDPFIVDANIQFSSRGSGAFKSSETLIYKNGYNVTEIFRDFWINKEQLTGLNRNISTGGDFLVLDNLKYKVVGVDEKFRTGWVLLTCVQSDLSNE